MAAGSRLRPHASEEGFAAPLPPPSRDSVRSPGPVLFSALGPTRGADVIVGREVADAFELIWPTGEIDDQFLGWPLSEEPGAALPDPPPAIGEGPAPPDHVLPPIRRANGLDPVAIDQSALLPCLPERSLGATMPETRRSAFKRRISGLRRR